MYKLKNWGSLEMHARILGIEIDPENPRESRLNIAMTYHERKKYTEAVEAMKGEPASEVDIFLLMATFGVDSEKPRAFYEGFPEVDKPTQ